MKPLHRIAKNAISMLSSQALSSLVGSVSVVYLARALGPSEFGVVNLASTAAGYLVLSSDWGLRTLGTREVARDRRRLREHVSEIVGARLLLALATLAALAAALPFLHQLPETGRLILAYALIVAPASLATEWVFQGLEQMEFVALSRLISQLSYAGSILLVVKGPQELVMIPILWVAANGLSTALLLVILVRRFGWAPPRMGLRRSKELLAEALPIGTANLMILVINSVDVIAIGVMRAPFDVGQYTAALKLFTLMMMVGGAFGDAVYPVISRLYKTSLPALGEAHTAIVGLAVALAFPVAVGGTLVAGPVIEYLYGNNYSGAVLPLQVLLWAIAIQLVLIPYGRGLWACDKQVGYLRIVTIQAFAGSVANVALIFVLGPVGGAVSRVVVEVIGLILYYRTFNRDVARVPLSSCLPRPAVASALMGAVIVWALVIGLGLPVVLLIGAASYMALLWLVGGTRLVAAGLAAVDRPVPNSAGQG